MEWGLLAASAPSESPRLGRGGCAGPSHGLRGCWAVIRHLARCLESAVSLIIVDILFLKGFLIDSELLQRRDCAISAMAGLRANPLALSN